MKLNLTNILILSGVVILTLRFRTQLVEMLAKVPVVGGVVA